MNLRKAIRRRLFSYQSVAWRSYEKPADSFRFRQVVLRACAFELSFAQFHRLLRLHEAQ